MLDHLKDSKKFSVLDMKSSFHQIKIAPEDKHKTAFVCCEGLFEFERMSMGMSNAAGCLQRFLETVFADMVGKGLLIYIDDLICYSSTEEEHEKLLEKVLKRLEEVKLTLRPEKCQFFKEEVQYLGHLVSAKGIYPLYENIKKILEYPVPTDLTTLRGFVGLGAYYRQFQKDFAKHAKPLTEMTKKGQAWVWGPRQQEAFERIKNNLVSPPYTGISQV